MGNCCSCNLPPPQQQPQQRVVFSIPPNAQVTRLGFAMLAICAAFLNDNFSNQDGFAFALFCGAYSFICSGNGYQDAVQGLGLMAQRGCGPDTSLYDSIAESISTFNSKGTRDGRPWVLIVITDGEDTSSTTFRTPRAIGDHVRSTFATSNNDNYVFVLGVGLSTPGRRALVEMTTGGDAHGFFAIHVSDFRVLELYLKLIRLQVMAGIQVNIASLETSQVSAQMLQLERTVAVQSRNMDIFFLVDNSYSMMNMA